MGGMERLLNFEEPLDVPLLDQVVDSFFNGTATSGAQELLVRFQNHPDAWSRVDSILAASGSEQTRLLALNILEAAVKSRWNILPVEQREGIKQYVVDQIIKRSSGDQAATSSSVYMRKLRLILVQIVKREWPHNWPTFVSDLVNSSKSSERLCENNMQIFQLMSEEFFGAEAKNEMTKNKRQQFQQQLNKEFFLVFQLCQWVLRASKDQTLLGTTLSTLQRFLAWIPVGYIFETDLLESLTVRFFPEPVFQNKALSCLAEIASIDAASIKQYTPKMLHTFAAVMQRVSHVLRDDVDIAAVYDSGHGSSQAFVRHLSNFLASFLPQFITGLEDNKDMVDFIVPALAVMLRVSQVDDTVIFKICLEFWIKFVSDVYLTRAPPNRAGIPSLLQLQTQPVGGGDLRIGRYAQVLSQLRLVMISKMAKPEEVLIVEDENGDIVRETMKDTDAITQYKSMRECLIYLCHLDPHDTQVTMLNKLSRQIDGSEWSWHNLNTLCWAIGSISGAMSIEMEKNFLVSVIKDLLGLCEMKSGKKHKAVIASNIMYVVGQYPRFLKQHWRFLKTVVRKLFEFMHEPFPGVQDMAVDTFLKMSRRCKKRFVVQQREDTRPFINQVLDELDDIIKDLDTPQTQTVYEALGVIIESELVPYERQRLLEALMALPNASWTHIVQQANHSIEVLWEPTAVTTIKSILRTNTRVARAMGPSFMVQLGRIYVEMLQVYKALSEFVSRQIAQQGVGITQTSLVRHMRSVKAETLRLIETFVANAKVVDHAAILQNFLPPLLDPVLDDYKRNVPEARDPIVLKLFSTIVMQLGEQLTDSVPRIFDSLFQCTIDMITQNFEDFPEHRIQFFELLRAVNQKCFRSFFMLSAQQFQLVMDSIAWAFKHLERNVADTGLQMLNELLDNVANSEAADEFYANFLLKVLQDVLAVLTDTFHKPGFSVQCDIILQIVSAVEQGRVRVQLCPQNAPSHLLDNRAYVRHYLVELIGSAFGAQITRVQIEQFVERLFEQYNDAEAAKQTFRDFLIRLKEFASADDDNEELFRAEREQEIAQKMAAEQARIQQVPGLEYVGPETRTDDGRLMSLENEEGERVMD